MSQVPYRVNLSAATFPFVSRHQGRTVIVPGPDNSFNRQVQSNADNDKDVGIPQVYYCHNVIPNGDGFQSVGFLQRITSVDGSDYGINQAFNVRDDAYLGGSKIFLMRYPGGFFWTDDVTQNYQGSANSYWDPGAAAFVPLPADLADRQITLAHVAGVSYLYIEKSVCLKWDFANSQLELVTLTSLVATDIVGITESSGYLVAYSSNAVAWSSLIDPTDFTPSLQTGAGGGNVDGIKGNITCGAPTSNGFTLYTAANAVSVLYTGNTQYPFQFAECIGAGGVSNLERVTFDSDSGFNYAYTSYGFQLIKGKTAESVFPELTDFIAGQILEDFDELTNVFTYTNLTAPLKKKLAFVANRYLIVSYGITELTHAIVYDSVQKRFGKLKFTHTDVFQYDVLTEATSDVPRECIGMLTKTGAMFIVNFALSSIARTGVLLLGKYQYVRTRKLQLQAAEIEGPTSGGIFTATDLVSNDGKNYDQVIEGTALTLATDLGVYGFGSPVGTNHSLLCKGAFNITSIVLRFSVHGRM